MGGFKPYQINSNQMNIMAEDSLVSVSRVNGQRLYKIKDQLDNQSSPGRAGSATAASGYKFSPKKRALETSMRGAEESKIDKMLLQRLNKLQNYLGPGGADISNLE